MIKGIENRSNTVPIDSTVETIEQVAENAKLSPEEVSDLLEVLGGGGVIGLIRFGAERLSNALGDDWPTETVYEVISGTRHRNFPPNGKK